MSIEDPRLSSIDNTSAADEFDSAVEQHLGFASEAVEGIEVAQVEAPEAGRTDRLPAQQPADVAAAVIPSEVTPDNENVVTLPAGIELDNLEFQVDGENLVLVLADGTEITVIGGAANIPTFVVGDVELPQVALFAALEESNINVAAGPDGTFSAQGAPISSRSFNDDPIGPGPEDLALADLLGDTSFGDELRTGVVFGGNGRPSIPTPLTTSFIYDEAVIAGGDGVKIISGRLPFNPGPDSGTITAIGFVGASDVNEGDGLKVLGGFTSGGLPITVTSFPAPTDGTDLDFLALEGRDSAGNLVFTITITNRVEGDFTFELFGKLEHPDAGSNGSQDDADDLLRLGFTYTVTDRDGDSVTGTFNIDVQDDAPTIGAPVGGSVNEDDLTSQVVEPKLVKRVSDSESDSDLLSSSTSKAEGSLAIRWGADNDLKSETLGEDGEPNGDDPVGRTVSFTGLDTSSTSEEIQAAIPGLAGLSSDGSRLSYRIDYTTGADGKWNGGYQLVAYKAFSDGPLKPLFIEGEGDAFLEFPYRGDGETIFIITLNPTTANGSYTFELIGNLDHYAAGGNGSVPSETDASARVFGSETPRVPVDFLDFEIPFTATDSDGDSADGKFTVRVEDDEPVIIGRPIAHTVDEDDISTIGRDIPGESLGTSPNDGNRDGSFTGDRGSNNPGPATVSGSFAGMVDFGADNRFTTYSIIDEDAARDVLTRLGLTSKGGVLSFDLIGDTLYAFVNAGAPGVVYNAGPDRLVFTLTVEADGEYAFKLFDQLDHDLGKGQNTDLQDKIEGDVRDIDFGQIIKASDFDGDSVPLTGYFSVTIRDDVPELVRGASEHRTVDEDDISTLGDRFPGESLGTSPNDGNADGSFTGSQGNNQPGPAFLSGSLASLVKSGADESLTFSFINGDVARGMLESLGLSSKGAELSYEIRNGVLYAFDNAGSELGKSYDPQFGDRLVFELKLNGNGSYEFRLYDQLDHDAPGDDFWERPTNSDENFDLQDGLWFKDVTAINFGALIKATDYDGDSVSLNNAFSIKIRDDVPELSGREENRLVDEDDIRTSRSVGTSPNDGNGDGSYTGSPSNNQPGPAFISGSLANLIKGGADDTVKFSFIREQTAVSELQFLGLSSKGVKLSYDIQGKTLYAYDNDAGDAGYGQGDRLVFKLTVNEDGSYTFELHDQLDHDLGKGQNTDLQDGFRYKDVEAIDFGSIIKATDFDGDSVILKDAFSITIKDDVPELSGAKEERLVDEDDIKTSRSVGTSPNDGNGDGSFTGSPNNNQPGPAFISGSLANLIKGGADDTVKFSFISRPTAVSELQFLGLSSKGVKLSYDIEGKTLYAYDNDAGDAGYGHGDRLVFKLTVNEDGSYTFELHDQLDHDLGKGQNTDLQDGFRYKDVEAIDFGSIIKATDFDGDSVILKDAFTITIKDDVPTAVARNTNETLVVDESDRRQNDDVDGPLNVFRFVGTKGEDPNMSAQFAQQSNFVAADINGGADDDVKIEWDLKINGGDRTPSGLFTTDGRSIVLFLENGLIVGRYDGPDGNSTVNSSDPAAFALHLSDNGTLSLVQYVSIRHDDPSDHDENDDANDRNPSTALQTLAGKVNAVLTVTDYDGDKAVSEVAVGNRIQFEDDGPSVKPYDVNTMRIISDDDTVAGRNGNPGFGSNTADGSGSDSKEYNKTGTLQFSAGADGGTVAWDLTKVSVDSGATGITFSVNSSGTLLIFQNQGGSAPVQIAQVTLNAVTGAYVYTQTANLLHTAGGEENEAAFTLGFTVTDGDGDKADGKLTLLIDDDTPVVKPYDVNTMRIISDDDTVAGRNGNPGFGSNTADGSGSDSKEYNKTGTLQFSAGADGGTVAWDLTKVSVDSGATGITFSVNSSGTLLIFQDQGGNTPVQIAQVTLNAVTGAYVYTQTANLLHTAGGEENEAGFTLGFTVTDGDGDKADGKLALLIDDDTPTLVSTPTTGLSLNEDDLILGNDESAPKELLSATGNLNISLGADGGSIALSAPAAEWSATNKTLTATDGSWKVTLNSDGTYKFDLLDNTLAHGFGDNGENTFSVEVTYTATDGDQDVLTGSFTIEIVDDVPVAVGESATVRESAPGVGGNLILAFDVSGSMSDPVNGGGSASRISVAKQAAINLINASDATMIMVVTFAGNAQASQWLSKADALAFIQGNGFPSPAGGTEYDDAVEAIMDANAGANLTGTNTSLYFFSDGRVSDDDDLSNSELRAWENFLRANDIDSYAVGVGSNVSEDDSDLGQIAFPNNVDNVIVITSPTDPILLGTVTVPAVPTSASGNVLTNDSFGADGGRIQSILVDDVTRTWDGTEANEVLNVTTALGGSLMFNFRTGDWEYNAPAQLVSNTPETFTYTLVDGDGDTTTANLVVNVQAVNDAPENAVPSSLTAAEDIELSITNVSVSDADAGNGDLTVKLEVKKGTLTLASEDDLVVSDNGSGTVTLTGSLTAINAALLGMKYKGDLNFNGSDELKITTTDKGNTGLGGAKTDVDTVAITVTPVNDAPVMQNASPTLTTINEDAITNSGHRVSSILGASVNDVDTGAVEGIAITGTSNGNGTWQYSTDGNNWVNFGSYSQSNALLLAADDRVRFLPNGENGTTATFNYVAWDQTSGAAGSMVDVGTRGGTTAFSTEENTASITVTAVNDAPVNTLPLSLTAVEDTELAITGVSISDVDANSGNMTVKLEVKDGTLTVASTQGVTAVSSSGGATLTLTGTVTAINTALAGLKYKGDLNFNGSDQLKITTTDNGNTGAGGPKSDVDTVNITVTPVPDTATISGKQNVDMRSYDKVVYNNASHDPQGDTAATVSNFDVANHKIAITVGSPALPVTGGAFVTVSSLSDIDAAGSVIEILREINSSANDGDNAAIERLIYRSIDDIPQGFYTVIVYGSTRSNADAYIFTMKVNSTQSGNQTLDTDEFSIEHVMTLKGVGYGNLRASNFVAAADPIILDLDRNGFAFSSIDNGVTFDINADGKTDQIAWTSDDGILAFDVDGNGLIDNGSEIFTPDFNGGKFASGVAALASLDSNGDGKIDSSDDAFSKLKIWVDANNNGISDEGELSSLFDNGVTSISLTTDNTGGQEDGQTVFSTGTFTFADGSTGDFMEVGFDTIFGSDADPLTVMGTDGDDILHGGMGQVVMTGGAGNDTFVFDGTALDELDVADVITDFNGDGDVLDVTALLDSLLGEQASAETAASHLRATVDDGNTTVSVQTGADTWKDVVVLQNHDTAIKVLFDDKHAVVTPHD